MCSSSVLFLLALSALSPFATGFQLNIDCGSATGSTYTDGRKWVGDTAYTQSGESMEVNDPPMSDQVMNTLRVFSSGKGCYSVPGVPQQQVLVRASFLYGNYNGNSSPPTFDLLLENSKWTEVITKNDTQTFLYEEATYFVTGGTVDVCVSNTSDDQIPFMSALEIRSMNTDMYKDFNTNTAFVLLGREFFGGGTDRSVLDQSGRYWKPLLLTNTSSSDDVASVPTPDNLPEGALSQALTAETGSDSLALQLVGLPDKSVSVYVIMYFSEVNPTTGPRSFDIYVDGDLSTTGGPIKVPPYGQVSNFVMHNISASSSSVISLNATQDSALPPLVNAYEIYKVIDIVQPAAHSRAPPVSTGTKILAVLWAIVGMYL